MNANQCVGACFRYFKPTRKWNGEFRFSSGGLAKFIEYYVKKGRSRITVFKGFAFDGVCITLCKLMKRQGLKCCLHLSECIIAKNNGYELSFCQLIIGIFEMVSNFY